MTTNSDEERIAQPNWNIELSAQLLANWPIRDVLVGLAYAATHLLTDHDCDAHGYEQLQHMVVAARGHADLLDRQAAGDAPRWTTNPPTAEGYYWYRWQGQLSMYYFFGGALYGMLSAEGQHPPLFDAEWLGPITPTSTLATALSSLTLDQGEQRKENQ